MALFDDLFSGGNWVTGLAIGLGAVIVLPLAAPVLRPLAKTAIKGGILAYRGAPDCLKGSAISSPKLPPRAKRSLPRRRWRRLQRPHDDAAATQGRD